MSPPFSLKPSCKTDSSDQPTTSKLAPSDISQFMRGQLFQTPRLPKVDFAGKTVVVTGANSGLGFECAKHL
jgi:hypothetical protein